MGQGSWRRNGLKRRKAGQGAGGRIGGARLGLGGREGEQSGEKEGDGEIVGGEWRGMDERARGDGEMYRTALQHEVLL